MVFRPSTFFIVIDTIYGLNLEIQLVPIMQVYIKASDDNKGHLRGVFTSIKYVVKCIMMRIAMSIKSFCHTGLCGDFNDVKADDFRTTNGLIEGTALSFANTWRTDTTCNAVNNRHDPCTMSIHKGGS